ncbi:MAG: glutathione-disulfide reductase [Gammaproteobacteria bacterium]|nr:glutathione-disulfide reductase [Gammaproteobacteria bacterium]
MADFDYDLFIIGAGSGGVRAARMSASLGANVAIAEDRSMGGTCVNVGCVPKKMLVYASHFNEECENAVGFGWSSEARRFDWNTLIANKNQEIHRLNGVYERLLRDAGARIFNGRACLVDQHTVTVASETITAQNILVAVGGWPYVPDIPGKEHVITSNEAFFLPELPRRILIVGGGYIAVEFAGIFNGLGSEVTEIYRGPLFLRGFDDDAREFVAREVRKKGVDLRFQIDVSTIRKQGEELTVELTDGTTLGCDVVMYATGRRPLTSDLGLEACGVDLDAQGAIIVDERYRTNVESIYAIGDVTNRINLTPVALAEGTSLAWDLFSKDDKRVEYEYVPSAVFSQPNLGTVGYTEAKAREKYGEIAVYRSSFTALKHTISGSDEKTLMKLIVDNRTDRVVGVHMVGPEAGETIQGIAIALKAGATKAVFDRTIGIHPTAAEEFVTMREPV